MIDDLLEQGIIRPSKSPFASPAFLVPKSGRGFQMVVICRKVNSTVVFDSYPIPTIEQFGSMLVLSVLHLYSGYYQIPLSFPSRQVTAFCKPFGLF
jgi:hypothetical protein